eukprot:scaffold5322_cov59-Phaeocystis_antarctica.AAC.8
MSGGTDRLIPQQRATHDLPSARAAFEPVNWRRRNAEPCAWIGEVGPGNEIAIRRIVLAD